MPAVRPETPFALTLFAIGIPFALWWLSAYYHWKDFLNRTQKGVRRKAGGFFDRSQSYAATHFAAIVIFLGTLAVVGQPIADNALNWILWYFVASLVCVATSASAGRVRYCEDWQNWLCGSQPVHDRRYPLLGGRFEEAIDDIGHRSRGPVLDILSLCVVVTRRLSLHEHWKHIVSRPLLYRTQSENTPAWAIDVYLMWWLPLLISAAFISSTSIAAHRAAFVFAAAYSILEVLQASFFYQVYRPAISHQKMRSIHSGIRSLVLSFSDYAKMVWLFGLIYWWQFPERDNWKDCYSPISVWDCIYFSTVTAATVGFGDLAPARSAGWLQLVVALEIVCALIMTLIIIARTVGLIATMQDSAPTTRLR